MNRISNRGEQKKERSLNRDSIYFSEWIYLNKSVGDSWESKSEYADLVRITMKRRFDTTISNLTLNNCVEFVVKPIIGSSFSKKKIYLDVERLIVLKKEYYQRNSLLSRVKLDSIKVKSRCRKKQTKFINK